MQYLSIFFLTIGFSLSLILFLMPRLAIWSLLISTMILTGIIWYFYPTCARIQWINPIMSIILFFRIIFDTLQKQDDYNGFPPIMFLFIFLFIFLSIVTSLANFYLKESLVTAKNYFQFCTLPFILSYGVDSENDMSSYMKTFLYIALFTPLIVLFQFYVMGAGHDTVTGTFGSTYNAAGGPNAALSIFIVSQVTVLLLMAKEQLMSWWIVCLLIVWAFITLMLTMAQAIIGFIIIMFLFVVGKNFLKLSFSSITPLIVLCPIVLLLFNIYFNVVAQRTKMQSYTKSPNSYSEYIDRTLKLNLGTETNKLNRTNIILLWWKQNTEQSNIFQILFGNGLGSVKNAGLTKGHIQMRFGETNIAYTALACLLWDVGLIGTCLYICIYISGFTLARKLAKQNLPKIHKVFMSSAQLACLFFILSIPYKLSIIGNQPFNFYSFFILGYICFWQKKIRAVNYSIQLA